MTLSSLGPLTIIEKPSPQNYQQSTFQHQYYHRHQISSEEAVDNRHAIILITTYIT